MSKQRLAPGTFCLQPDPPPGALQSPLWTEAVGKIREVCNKRARWDQGGLVEIRHEEMAATIGKSERTVGLALANMVALGLMQLVKRGGGRGGVPSVYRVYHHPAGDAETGATGCAHSSADGKETSATDCASSEETGAMEQQNRRNALRLPLKNSEGICMHADALRAELAAAGIEGAAVDELAQAPGLTLTRLRLLEERAKAKGKTNPPALLARMLRDGEHRDLATISAETLARWHAETGEVAAVAGHELNGHELKYNGEGLRLAGQTIAPPDVPVDSIELHPRGSSPAIAARHCTREQPQSQTDLLARP